MKISKQRLMELRAAIEAAGGLTSAAGMRDRWDALWRSGYDVNKLYNDGLNDDHIDTALRAIAHD